MTVSTGQRRYAAEARSTDVFGRVLCTNRYHHFVVDGPVTNGCPGEEVTPGELFLTSIAACGVELVQVFAQQENVALARVGVEIDGEFDIENPVRADVTVFRKVRLRFELDGVSHDEAERLVERFKGR